jgi:hypothetical protein
VPPSLRAWAVRSCPDDDPTARARSWAGPDCPGAQRSQGEPEPAELPTLTLAESSLGNRLCRHPARPAQSRRVADSDVPLPNNGAGPSPGKNLLLRPTRRPPSWTADGPGAGPHRPRPEASPACIALGSPRRRLYPATRGSRLGTRRRRTAGRRWPRVMRPGALWAKAYARAPAWPVAQREMYRSVPDPGRRPNRSTGCRRVLACAGRPCWPAGENRALHSAARQA